MDFVNLLTKLEKIENKQILTESEDRPAAKKKETTWTDKSGKQHPATRVQGSKSVAADKEADKDRKKHDKDLDESMFKTELGKSLVREFGYNLNEAEFKFSPEQEKWLGGSDRQDPYILARMPGPKPPASYFTDPESQEIVKQRFSKVFTGPVGAPGAARPGADVQAGSGGAVQAGSGGNVQSSFPAPDTTSGGGASTTAADFQKTDKDTTPVGSPGSAGDQADQVYQGADANAGAPGAQDDVTGVDAAVAAQAAQQADTTAADTSGTGAGSSANPPTDDSQTVDPSKVNRFKELLARAEAGKASPDAAAPAQAAAPTGQAAAPAKPGSSANPPAAGGSYTIKPGDNLTKIAKANGTSVDAIMKANPQIKDPNKISAGAKLNLPGSGGNPPAAKPLPGKEVPGGGNIADNPAAESLSEDDRILSAIRSIAYR